jgi:hypothetical protein
LRTPLYRLLFVGSHARSRPINFASSLIFRNLAEALS